MPLRAVSSVGRNEETTDNEEVKPVLLSGR